MEGKKAKKHNSPFEDIKEDPYVNILSNNYTKLKIYSVPANSEISFNAMLTNFSDKFSQNWEETAVYGRMDEILTFAGTIREINISFNVPAYSALEAFKNMEKISKLASFQYPGYEEHFSSEDWMFANANTISTPPLFKVKMGNLITLPTAANVGSAKSAGLLCKMSGFEFNPVNEMGYFTPAKGAFLPKLVELSFDLKVLHTHELGWGMDHKKRTNPNNSSQRRGANFPYLIANDGGGPGREDAFYEEPVGNSCENVSQGISEGEVCNECGGNCPDVDCSMSSDPQCINDDRTSIQEEMNETHNQIVEDSLVNMLFSQGT